jgi:hypothetical protein
MSVVMRRILVIPACVIFLWGAPLAAQAEPDDVQHRNDCRLAAQVIRTSQPAPHTEWAYSYILRCGQEGAAVVAEQWRGQSSFDEQVLWRLMIAAGRLRTRAVYEAVREAAADQSASREVRIYALAMLYNYARPQLALVVQDLLHPRDGRFARIAASSGDGGLTNAPDLGDVRQEVEEFLAQLIASDADPDLVRVAREVLGRL